MEKDNSKFGEKKLNMNINFLKNIFFSFLFIIIGCKENGLKSEVIPLKKENTNSKISLQKVMYFIDANVISIKTTNEAKMRFNLYFENDDNMNLRISTIDAEDAYCEGHYKLIQKDNNIIKAIYDDEGICTEDGENIFYIKIENSKIYIKSQRFINDDWQELYKE